MEINYSFWTQIKIFHEIREVSDSSIDSNLTTTFKVQKGTKDIVKIVHVTTTVQP